MNATFNSVELYQTCKGGRSVRWEGFDGKVYDAIPVEVNYRRGIVILDYKVPRFGQVRTYVPRECFPRIRPTTYRPDLANGQRID